MGAGRGASTHGRSATRSNSWARCSPSVGASASMPSVRADAYGLPATTASSDALETYDRAVDGLLGWDAEALDRFGAAATTDPGLALAHAGLAICLFLDERFVEARGSAERARTAASTQTLRERGHVEAIALLVEGKVHDAEAAMTRHLGDFPRDLVVFQRLYFVWFWQGKFGEMLDLSSVLTRYYPGSSFMLGLHAFALEQTGRCDEALRIAQAAIGKNPRDAWSVHALAHALYELGAFDTGVTRLPPAIHPCAHLGWFRNHLLWHLILMHLGRGEYERASGLGRTVFERELSSIRGDRRRAPGPPALALPRGPLGDGARRGRRLGHGRAPARDAPRAGRARPHGAHRPGARAAGRGPPRLRGGRLPADGRADRAAPRTDRRARGAPRPARRVPRHALRGVLPRG